MTDELDRLIHEADNIRTTLKCLIADRKRSEEKQKRLDERATQLRKDIDYLVIHG